MRRLRGERFERNLVVAGGDLWSEHSEEERVLQVLHDFENGRLENAQIGSKNDGIRR
jgi:hypothetical protein